MKAATIALIFRQTPKETTPAWVDTLSDDREIDLFEAATIEACMDPLRAVYDHREKQEVEESEFGDYIEELLSQPFVRPEIQDHAVQWFKSKIRIEQFQKAEAEAAKVIADYAYQVFKDDPSRTDFFLSGPTTTVRVRIFVLSENSRNSASAA